MASLSATLEHKGVTYLAEIVKIRSTFLGQEDHGIWTASLTLTGAGWSQAAGNYILDEKPTHSGARRYGSAFGMDHVMRIVETLGCRSWEGVKGASCLALRLDSFGPIEGIADFKAERVLIFATHAVEFQEVAS